MNKQWKEKFDELESYIKQEGKLPTEKENEGLYYWVSKQSSTMNRIAVNRKKVISLLKRYKVFEEIKNNAWDNTFYLLKKYLEETSKVPTKSESSYLYNWIFKHTHSKSEELNKQRILALLAPYKAKNKNIEIFNKRVESLEVFIKEVGEKPTTKTNDKLYRFVYDNTKSVRSKPERAKVINELFEKLPKCETENENNIKSWDEKFKELETYLKQKGQIPTAKNKRLYSFVYSHMRASNKNTVKQKMLNDLLEMYGLSKSKVKGLQEKWQDRLNKLECFLIENGKIPTEKTDRALYYWVVRNTSVSKSKPERVKIINELFKKYGVSKKSEKVKNQEQLNSRNQEQWNSRFDDLERFIKRTGQRPNLNTDKKLTSWVNTYKNGVSKDTEKSKQINELFERYDCEVNVFHIEWSNKFSDLECFLKETGQKPTKKTNMRLYYWVHYNTTSCYKKSDRANKITKAIKKYVLTGDDLKAWNKKFEELEIFVKETDKKPCEKTNNGLYQFVYKNTTGCYKNSHRSRKIETMIEKYIQHSIKINKLFEKYKLSGEKMISDERFNELECFLKETGKNPTIKTNKKLCHWISTNTSGSREYTEKSIKINNLLEKYNVKFIKWESRFTELELFIKKTGEKPTLQSNPQLTEWINYNTEGIRQYTKESMMINDLFDKHGLK